MSLALEKNNDRRPRGFITLSILTAIEQGVYGLGDIWIATVSSETYFGASLQKTQRLIRRREDERERRHCEQKERHIISSLIYQLKQEGFLKPSPTPQGWLTKLGKEKLKQLKDYFNHQKKYNEPRPGPLILVIFDVPEKYKGYREWIRSVLQRIGFQLLQRSVFIGRIHIPEEFIRELHQKNLLHYVHIFEIKAPGTLQKYIKRYIDGVVEYEL